jgi:hypothetical protein
MAGGEDPRSAWLQSLARGLPLVPSSTKAMTTRRQFTTALIGVPAMLRAQQAPGRARIKIDTERVIGDIDPLIYGNFIEHLGRCIEGGVFEEGSPLSDANGYRKDVLEAVKKLNVSILRWPGGNFVSNYHWRDGIGPRDQRPRRLEMAWGTVESNRFGTHEFLEYADMLKTQPYICVNLGTGTWTDAQQWVEYVTSSQDTAMTRLRKQNGRAEPWKVTYWGLGNEMDGPWQMGHRSAEDRLRQVRAGSGQADEVDRPEPEADRGRVVALRARDRLDRVEPHDPGAFEDAHRLPGGASLRGQSRGQLLRVPHQLARPG